MKPLRISAISYLNTVPLMWDFEHGPAGAGFEVSYTLPSACAAALKAGTADIGIIPAAAYTTIAGLVILPDVAIAARGAVLSILLVCRTPIEAVRSVALDTSSMTSVALTKVLFHYWWQRAPQFSSLEPPLENMLLDHDAALLIGDPALQVDCSKYLTYDLAAEWLKLTGKPFVFAFWGVRAAALERTDGDELTRIFQRSRDHGLEPENINLTALEWSRRLAMPEDQVRAYLQDNIFYYMPSDCVEGLQLFYAYANACGALPAAPPLRFAGAGHTVAT